LLEEGKNTKGQKRSVVKKGNMKLQKLPVSRKAKKKRENFQGFLSPLYISRKTSLAAISYIRSAPRGKTQGNKEGSRPSHQRKGRLMGGEGERSPGGGTKN